METTFKQANKYFVNGELEKSILLYNQCVAENVGFGPYYQNLGYAYEQLGDINAASRNIRIALSLSPKFEFLKNKLHRLERQKAEKSPIDAPFLSIIVPVYNSKQYLSRCLESILTQSFEDFELIVVNDGSDDGSWGVIKALSAKDSRIVVISNDSASGNPGTPRNQALDIARGKYIGFVDSDDWIDDDYYANLVAKAEEEQSDIVFSGGFKNTIGTFVEERRYNSTFFDDVNSPNYKFHESFMIWDKIFKADIIKDFGIRLGETKAAVDVPFIFKCYYYSHLISTCENLLGYNYRRESDSSVTVNFRKKSDCQFEFDAYQAIFDWADDADLPRYYLKLIDIKMINSYLYTLKIISPEYFNAFFEKAKFLFSDINEEDIKKFAETAQKWWLYKEFCAVLSSTPEEYYERLQPERLRNERRKQKQSFKKKWEIEGEGKGIMFFPAWVQGNPYQQLLYTAIANEYNIRIAGYDAALLCKELLDVNRDEFDYIHLHWLHSFLDPNVVDSAEKIADVLRHAKSLGYKILYTAHNIISHDTTNLRAESTQRKLILSQVDHVFAHGVAAKQILIDKLDVAPPKILMMPHGTYEGCYPNTISKEDARHRFGIDNDAFVFLFFGNIRGYKGLEPLLLEFKKLCDNVNTRKKVVLIIAGKIVDKASVELVNAEVKANNNIIFNPGFVSDEDVQAYFNAADICILPYRRIVTSGAAMLSLTFKCPVLAPREGVLPEIITSDVGLLFSDYDEMGHCMEELALNVKDLSCSAKNDEKYNELLERLSWKNVVKNLSSVFE